MVTNQPIWKFAGHIGDIDPIAYGGGFIYTDETNVYCPEMTWFEPASDEEWHKTEGQTPVQVYRVLLEKDSEMEWWYSRLSEIASYAGQAVQELQRIAHSSNPVELASLYSSLIGYFGIANFDEYPTAITEDEAYRKYAGEMDASRRA